ncbi:hypothetical protein IKG68_01515 [Candidatus Saccharibacteria bacterium]|nr:hypothetical protein [Candidatus Saccharibacteria bacterium]
MHTKSHKLNLILAVTVLIAFAAIYNICKIPLVTHAEEPVLTDSSSSVFSLSSDRSLTVSVSSANIDLALTPSAEGIFKSTSDTPLTVTVSTNNATGYNLNMTTTTTDLTRTTSLSGQTPVIHTLSGSGSFTSDTFETNAWGFSLDGATYQPVTLSRQITQTTKESNNSTTNITFAAKLNNEIPHGEYRSTITFIATTNPLEATFDTAFDAAGKTQVSYNGNNYYKMQDMSGFICSMVATPADTTSAESTQLIDTRDNSIYWVSKLLDGNCWMTQNLDLNLDSSVALTSADTDLHSVTSWTPTRSTINSTAYNNTASGASGGILTFNNGAQNGNFAPNFSDSTSSDMTVNANNSPYSADPGYRYVAPKEMSGPNTNWYDNGDTFYYCTNQDTTCGGNSENGHYTMGNFYNFAAANATNNVETTLGGSANVVQNKVMPDSICPKGWRLPIDQTTNNEFNTLLGASNYNVTSNFNFAGLNAIRTAPLYFVRSGFVSGGTLHDAGVRSLASWSSTISPSTGGYHLRFDSTDIYPAFYSDRVFGFPVRCLARTDLTIEDATYLQDVTPEMRQNTRVGTTATLRDKRDNEEYTIGKLADGNVWLLDNLRLGASPIVDPISSSNTNIDSTISFTLPTETHNPGSTVYAAVNYDYVNQADSNGWKNGVFYNYIAATAGTRSAALNNLTTNSTMDICPSGWKMPNISSPSNNAGNLIYDTIRSIYGSDNNIINALHIPTLINYIAGGNYITGTGAARIWGGVAYYDDGQREVRVVGIGVKSVSSAEVYDSNSTSALQPVRCILK